MQKIITIILGLGLLLAGVTGCKKKADSPAVAGQENQFTQSINIDPKVFVPSLRGLLPPKPGESSKALLLRYLVENGVAMEPPSDVMVDEIGNRVLVRATESQRQKIKELFDRIEKGR